jgi:hypothetical protein
LGFDVADGVIAAEAAIPVYRFLSFFKGKRQKGERLITKMDCGFRRNDTRPFSLTFNS